MRTLGLIMLMIALPTAGGMLRAQYISEVYEYVPAPGQFVNDETWGVPASAETIKGGLSGTLTLGAYGGYVVFGFASPVENDPANPYGVDFTIFGNPSPTSAEPATVWVMKDENHNGQPDDTWYQLAGSDYFFSSTLHDYEVTYFNPHSATAADVPWEDNCGGSGCLKADTNYHRQPYYPCSANFPAIPPDSYTLGGTKIAGSVDRSLAANIISHRRPFGYADNQLRGVPPYTLPDNPYTAARENSGGDAFDISWAVDANGNYVDLDVIHFVKVQNALLENVGWLGELSTEIAGAIDVPPNNSVSGVDKIIVTDIADTVFSGDTLTTFVFSAGRLQPEARVTWSCSSPSVLVDDNNVVHFDEPQTVQLTATLINDVSINTTVNVVLSNGNGMQLLDSEAVIRMYPNPASDILHIDVSKPELVGAVVDLYDASGRRVRRFHLRDYHNAVDVTSLLSGVYVATILKKLVFKLEIRK